MIWKYKLKVFNSKKEGFLIMGIIFVIGIVWDFIAVSRGYWTFHSPHVLSFRIGLIPLEEYLLFLVVPLWFIVFYKVIHEKRR